MTVVDVVEEWRAGLTFDREGSWQRALPFRLRQTMYDLDSRSGRPLPYSPCEFRQYLGLAFRQQLDFARG
jgi:hypothetical protein